MRGTEAIVSFLPCIFCITMIKNRKDDKAKAEGSLEQQKRELTCSWCNPIGHFLLDSRRYTRFAKGYQIIFIITKIYVSLVLPFCWKKMILVSVLVERDCNTLFVVWI